jgi:hypothetical protein
MFDRFVVIDWSANSTPKRGRDSIWVAVLDDNGISVSNPSTRAAAEQGVAELVEADPSGRSLIGVDFSLGYPAGTASALGLTGCPWASMARLLGESILDDERNSNNRFEVASALNARMTATGSPFWGCPPAIAGDTLTPTKPASFAPLDEWRIVESVLREQGHRPFSSWQLLGAGAVGSQSLLGLPMIHRLATRFADRVSVWPFTTGLRAPNLDSGSVIVAEVWPALVPLAVADGVVRDQAQVVAVAEWLAGLDAADRLADLFSPDAAGLEDVAVIEREEGWVLGVGC